VEEVNHIYKGGKKMKGLKIILSIFVALIIASAPLSNVGAFSFIGSGNNQGNKEEQSAEYQTFTAEEYFELMQAHFTKRSFNQVFKTKKVAVSGIIKSIYKSARGSYLVVDLDAGNDNKVSAFFKESQVSIGDFSKGQEITVIGKPDGDIARDEQISVFIRDCTIKSDTEQ
jgi:hypothetical protein